MSFPDNKSFCALPWVHQAIDPDGEVKLCCTSLRNPSLGHVHSIDDSWNSPEMIEVRRKMLAGETIKDCERCYKYEAIGKLSSRQRWTAKWTNNPQFQDIFEGSLRNGLEVDQKPLYLDFKFGNLCNLQCKMCSSKFSTQIAKDMRKLQKMDPEGYDRFVGDQMIFNEMDWYENDRMWEMFDQYIPFLEEIYMTGGEPTLIEPSNRFLQRCVDQGHAEKIILRLNTNLTNLGDDFLELLSHFKQAHFSCSIDGTGLIQEYIRYPSKWKKVKENFIKLMVLKARPDSNIKVSISTAIQLFNILDAPDYLGEIISLIKRHEVSKSRNTRIGIIPVLTPTMLSISHAPDVVKQTAILRLMRWKDQNRKDIEKYFNDGLNSINGLIVMMTNPENASRSPSEILNYASFVDQNKKLDLATACPELERLLSSAIQP